MPLELDSSAWLVWVCAYMHDRLAWALISLLLSLSLSLGSLAPKPYTIHSLTLALISPLVRRRFRVGSDVEDSSSPATRGRQVFDVSPRFDV